MPVPLDIKKTTVQAPAQAVPFLPMIRTLGLVSLICGFSVTLAYQWTKPFVEENQRITTERAGRAVLPQAAVQKAFVLGPDGVAPATADSPAEDTVYVGYDAAGKIVGVAARGASPSLSVWERIMKNEGTRAIALAIALAGALGACSGSEPAEGITVPLSGTGTGGAVYVLRGARFRIAGPRTLTVHNVSEVPYITCSVAAPPDTFVSAPPEETCDHRTARG